MFINPTTKLILILSGIVVAVFFGIGLLLGTLSTGRHVEIGDTPGPVAFDEGGANGLPWYDNIYVNDYADLLDAGAEARIRDQLIALYGRSGIEMTVLTITRRADYGSTETNEAFATRLFNTWGIGNAARNDGVLVLVSRYDREMRIELGRFYGHRYDGAAQRVIDAHFLPFFRQDRYQEGIEEGVAETIAMVSGLHPDDAGKSVLTRGWSIAGRWLEGIGLWIAPLIAAVGAVLAKAGLVLNRRLPRVCPNCRRKMYLLSEDVDDAHLEGPQRLEERLKSVDYDVWLCPGCEHLTIRRFPRWFSRFGACPACGYRTQEADTTILRSATTSSTGLKRIDYDCRNCGHQYSETRTIPRKSSSSSSGGSSFGGGSSGGGGASGSW